MSDGTEGLRAEPEPPGKDASVSIFSSSIPDLVDCRRFRSSYGSIGVVLDFILATHPFAAMQAAVLYSAVKEQIAAGNHVAGSGAAS
jgi:hypothetical protein